SMSRCAAFFLLVCSFLAGVTSERYMTGGWEKRDPHENPHFQELAHYAVSKGSKPKRYYDTVVTLIEVYTQLVAGVNYRLNYTYATTDCRTDQEYKPSKCRPKGKVRGWCESIVYEMPCEHIVQISQHHCSSF
ncbi:cystatin, putative, partial [Ixodes scapularis]